MTGAWLSVINSYRLAPSVKRTQDYRAGGCGFKSRPDQHSGTLMTEEEALPL